jgi:hypothetical protein
MDSRRLTALILAAITVSLGTVTLIVRPLGVFEVIALAGLVLLPTVLTLLVLHHRVDVARAVAALPYLTVADCVIYGGVIGSILAIVVSCAIRPVHWTIITMVAANLTIGCVWRAWAHDYRAAIRDAKEP